MIVHCTVHIVVNICFNQVNNDGTIRMQNDKLITKKHVEGLGTSQYTDRCSEKGPNACLFKISIFVVDILEV